MNQQRSLKGTLLVAVAWLVVVSTLLVALLATHRYAQSLEQTLAAQAENVGRGLAAEVVDLVLVNDLVRLRNMLERQQEVHSFLAYLLILRDGRVLASTFGSRMPEGLLSFHTQNNLSPADIAVQKFISESGAHYLDMALPISGVPEGILRLGVSEIHLRREINNLWVRIGRLDVIPIHLPPLRERDNDVALLAQHFLRHFSSEQRKAVTEINPRAMRLLMDYHWPGNVRELENIIEQATVLAKFKVITPEELPARLKSAPPPARQTSTTLEEQERRTIVDALESCGGNKKLAAQRLGIGRSTLYGKMKRLGLAAGPES